MATIDAPWAKASWVSVPLPSAQAGVVGPQAQLRRIPFGLRAGRRVDDARAALFSRRRQHGGFLVAGLVEQPHGQVDLGPVEPPDDLGRVLQAQPPDDLLPDRGCSRGGQRGHHRARLQHLDHVDDPQVVGPEVVSPGAHAVGLVHRQQPGRCLGQDRADVFAGQLLGGQEHERRLPRPQQVVGGGPLAFGGAAVDGRPRAARAGSGARSGPAAARPAGTPPRPRRPARSWPADRRRTCPPRWA